MTELLFALLTFSRLGGDDLPSLLAVGASPEGVKELRVWAEFPTDKAVAEIPTLPGENGLVRLTPPKHPAPQTLWVRGANTAFAAVSWPLPPEPLQLPPPGAIQLTLQSGEPSDPAPETVAVRLLWTPLPDAPPRPVPAPVYTVRWDRAQGSLRLEGLPFGPRQRYDFQLSSPGYAPVELSRVDLWSAARVLDTVTLRRADRLCGTVHSPDGLAAEERVQVELRWDEHTLRVPADAHGAFCFPHSPRAVVATLRAASLYRSSASLDVRTPADGVTLAFPPLALLTGEVVAPDGALVEECQLTVVPDPGFELPRELATALAGQRVEASCRGGRFRLPRPWPGTALLVEVAAPSFPLARLPIPEGTASEELRVELSPGLRVKGQVRDAEGGTPVAGAKVTLTCPRSEPVDSVTDEDGNFTLSGVVPGGTCQGRVDHPDFPSLSEGVQISPKGPRRWDVTLRRGVRVRGRTLALPHGAPVAGAVVQFVGPNGARGTLTTDRDGNFVTGPLAGGSWAIVVSDEGATLATAELVLSPPAQPPPLTLWLERGEDIWGRVLGLAPPGQGATITFLQKDGRSSRTTTGYGAVFRANGLKQGWSHYSVRHPSLSAPCAGSLWIPSNPASQPLELSCTPPSVTLQVVGREATGQLVASAALVVQGRDGSRRTYLCQVEEGRGKVELVPGTYRILYHSSGHRQLLPLWEGAILSHLSLELVLPAPSP